MGLENVIAEIDAEITRLKQAKAVLETSGLLLAVKRGPGRPKAVTPTAAKKQRNLTPEGRAKIAAAVKARWARAKKKT